MASGATPAEGRVSRVVISALLAVGWGSDLFENAADPWLTAPRFLLMMAALLVLGWELTAQARRGAGDPFTRWTNSDTAIVGVLSGLAVLLVAALVFGHPPQHERTSGVAFIALYFALGGYYSVSRRRTLIVDPATAPRTAGPGDS